MDPTDELAALTRYVSGNCDPAESRSIEQWVAADASRGQLLAEIRTAWSVRQVKASTSDVDAAWHRATRALRTVSDRHTSRRWLYAASATLGLVAMLWGSLARYHVLHTSAVVYTTVSGQRESVTLPDGTRVQLAPESYLALASDFTDPTHTRMVILAGEAYFAVVHDVRHPFSVLAHNVNITDVGTEFDVQAYDADVHVAVAKGEISLRSRLPLPRPLPFAFGAGRGEFINDVREGGSEKRAPSAPVSATRPYDGNDTAYLSAGDVAEATDTGFMVTHHADLAAFVAWTLGRLVFEDTPLRDALRAVGRLYGLEVTIADSTLAAKPVTASFTNESADDVLEVITRAVSARYQRAGRAVVVRRGASRSADSSTFVPAVRVTQLSTGSSH